MAVNGNGQIQFFSRLKIFENNRILLLYNLDTNHEMSLFTGVSKIESNFFLGVYQCLPGQSWKFRKKFVDPSICHKFWKFVQKVTFRLGRTKI